MAQIEQLLQKTSHWDKDERYMATNDLCTVLQNNVTLDGPLERRVCESVLKQLNDSSNDVQSIAVKCLGILIQKVQQNHATEICTKLCDLTLGKEQLRDVYSIGLRTIITNVKDNMGNVISEALTTRLLRGIAQNDVPIKLECLDILSDLLKKFGRDAQQHHQQIVQDLLNQLNHENPTIRKRATSCLGNASIVISDAILNDLTGKLLFQIENPQSRQDIRLLIQTVGTISRNVGFRLANHLNRIIPLFIKFCGDPDDENLQNEQTNEIRENIFQGFESFVLRCPREVSPHIDEIINLSLSFMKYDPNYSYNESDAENDDDPDEYEDELSDENYGSDDDDTSWKVRRSAVRVLKGVIASRPESLKQIYQSCAEEIIRRFKEREENVRVDVIECFNQLLKGTIANDSRLDSLVSAQLHKSQLDSAFVIPHLVRQRSGVVFLQDLVHILLKACNKQLSIPTSKSSLNSSLKTKIAIYGVLKTLCSVLNGGIFVDVEGGKTNDLDDSRRLLLQNVQQALEDKKNVQQTTIKLEALAFLRLSIETHDAQVFYPYIPTFIGLIIDCISASDWYKLIAEGLRTICVFIKVMRPKDPSTDMFLSPDDGFDYSSYIQPIFNTIFSRLQAHDLDQEIKECAIEAMGVFVSIFGDQIYDSLPQVFEVFMERLKNEITRTTTLRAFTLISNSILMIDLSSILPELISELSQFLRQQNRPLKQTTLEALFAIVCTHSHQINPVQLNPVIEESRQLITDSDLFVSHLTLRLISTIIKKMPSTAPFVAEVLLPKTLDLILSSFLQGLALDSTLDFLKSLLIYNGITFDELFPRLIALTQNFASTLQQNKRASNNSEDVSLSKSAPFSKQIITNISRCIAALCEETSDEKRDQVLQQFLAEMEMPEDDDEERQMKKHIAFLCVGELGQHKNLSSISSALEAIIQKNFYSNQTSDHMKFAAAYCLGHVSVGNLSTFLPIILRSLESTPHKYLFFSSLKELINVHTNSTNLDFSPYVDQVLPILLQHCQTDEESIRNMVSECIGALIMIHPDRVLPSVIDCLVSAKSETTEQLEAKEDDQIDANLKPKYIKWSIISSIRYSAARLENTSQVEAMLSESMALFANERDLDVKKALLQMVNALIHHQPLLLSQRYQTEIFPVLVEVVDLKAERVVDLGPFKHKVDDGLPLRKEAISTVNTILDFIPQRFDLTFIPHLAKALRDHDDVQLLSHQVLTKICSYNPAAIISSMDVLIEPLDKCVTRKVKESDIGTAMQRFEDLIRSALRAIIAIEKIPESTQFTTFTELLKKIHSDGRLTGLYEFVRVEGVTQY